MNYQTSSLTISCRIWFLTSVNFSIGWAACFLIAGNWFKMGTSVLAFICACVGSLPVLLILPFLIRLIEFLKIDRSLKIRMLIGTLFIICLSYATLCGIVIRSFEYTAIEFFQIVLYAFAALAGSSLTATLLSLKRIRHYFTSYSTQTLLQTTHNMSTTQDYNPHWEAQEKHSNKLIIKGGITGALILLMLIPTLFISNLVSEREDRQKAVTKEVSSKWAASQTLGGPYLVLPYSVHATDEKGMITTITRELFLLPEKLDINGTIFPETRPRSIYKVLLYKATLSSIGHFIPQLPKDLPLNDVHWNEARICQGLSDFKGIEESIIIQFNGKQYELTPGLPSAKLDSIGLSAPVVFGPENLGKNNPFSFQLKLKGSEQLHFLPLSANSHFSLKSGWSSPSFDGNYLPSKKNVSDKGFEATWIFNKANLPFGTSFNTFNTNKDNLSFGVTMLQPSDQYAKTNRCIKYAILFIGLTFSLFFIVEIMQKKPVHPVQYLLIGLALVIFYTLLISISEFIFFDLAYGIASIATILLITLYAQAHFRNWKIATLFCAVLSSLYGFIFILLRLEDTALLVGSIGLFTVLALAMYFSRRINWYGTTNSIA